MSLILQKKTYGVFRQPNIYEVCPEGIQPRNMKIETFIEEDTRNTVHRTMTPPSSK